MPERARRAGRVARLGAGVLVLALGAAAGAAQERPAGGGLPALLPAGEPFTAQADTFEALSRDRYRLRGNVTFQSQGMLLQADEVTYDRATGQGEATGNVLYVQGTGRIAGERVTFDTEARTAVIEDATGYLDQGFLFRARRIIQLDDHRIRFEDGFFTACTQPVPYWSFSVHSGLVIRDRYVHLYSLALKAGKMPIFYSPYLIFPIKPDRATGLLLPQIGFSKRLGSSLGNAFFWDIQRNQDATFYLDVFSEGSLGGGLEHRFLPNDRGGSVLNAYGIDEDSIDDVSDEERRRWNVRYRLRQDFRSRGRLLADFNLVSDADYYLDFSRDPDRGSDPSALSRAEYVINRGYTSTNLRVERREQFFTTENVIQSRLPEAEMRIRSRRLGSSPLYFGLESSASLLDKSGPGFPSGSYGRVDIFPTLSMPTSPFPYLELTPTLRLRETYYSRALDPNQPDVFGDSLSREFVQFDLQALGPRMSRIFFDADGNGRLKSTIEPRLSYRYQTAPGAEENIRVPGFDEIDILPGDLNEIEYGVVSRLFARKVVRAPGEDGGEEDAADPAAPALPPMALPETDADAEPGPGDAASAALASRPGVVAPVVDDFSLYPGPPAGRTLLTSPVEVASFSISQRYSMDSPLSFDLEFVDTDDDGILDQLQTVGDSRFSPVTLGGRINPSAGTSIDARVSYDVLEGAVSQASLSAGLYDAGRGFLNATWFFRNGLDGATLSSSRLRVAGGTSFWRRKVSMAVALNYDATLSALQDQRYSFGYDTQCCGFAVEVLQRDFVGTEQREFRFVVNLRGIGNFIDLQGRGAGR